MIVTLGEAKLYLRVDSDAEDSLITGFIKAAEDIIEGVLRFPLSEFEENTPEPVKQAAYFIIGSFYEQRENISIKQVLDTVRRLLFAYRKEVF